MAVSAGRRLAGALAGVLGPNVQPASSGDHKADRCRDAECPRSSCYWYRTGYEDGWMDAAAAAEDGGS